MVFFATPTVALVQSTFINRYGTGATNELYIDLNLLFSIFEYAYNFASCEKQDTVF